jgi:general secretion pathway protein G
MCNLSNKRKKQTGFTLIEVMVVVVILGILAAVIVPKVMDNPDKARVVKARNDVGALKSALSMYKLDNYHYPSTDQGLQALVHKPGGSPEAEHWKQGGYLDNLPKDPWGHDYQYLNPGTHADVDIFSLGADGRPGGDGINSDIGNWDN